MASEFSSHIGMSGKLCCRICHARGLSNSPVDVPPSASTPSASHPPPGPSSAEAEAAAVQPSVTTFPERTEGSEPNTVPPVPVSESTSLPTLSTTAPSPVTAVASESAVPESDAENTGGTTVAPDPPPASSNTDSVAARLEEEENVRQFMTVRVFLSLSIVGRKLLVMFIFLERTLS